MDGAAVASRGRGRATRRGHHPGARAAHAIRATIQEAEAAKDAGDDRVILVAMCGHGHFDRWRLSPSQPEESWIGQAGLAFTMAIVRREEDVDDEQGRGA